MKKSGGNDVHHWTDAENIAVLVLTKRYGKVGWEEDPLAKILVSMHGIKKGSIKMAIQNFLYLMGKPGGLSKSSKRQKQAFLDYGQLSLEDLRSKADQELAQN